MKSQSPGTGTNSPSGSRSQLQKSVSSTAHKGGSTKTPQRITWGGKLATGYDRLKVGYHVNWERIEILETLADAKQQAQEANEPIPVSFTENGDLVFNCHPTGRKGGYAYHLSRADVSIFISRRKDISKTPNVWVDIGSLSCWQPGYEFVISEVERLIKAMSGRIIRNKVSEVHLCADFIGLDIEELPIETEAHWITRANLFNRYSSHSKMSGITYKQTEGKLPRGSKDTISIRESGIILGAGDIMLRIYDKQLEMKQNLIKKSVFHSLWKINDEDKVHVTRVEFQLRRRVLKQMKVDTLKHLEKKKCGIWRYCTFQWTRLSLHSVDRANRHQDRSELHPWWQQVHNITFESPEMPAVIREKIQPAKHIDVYTNMMAGLALSLGTIINRKPNDLEGVIAYAQGYLETKIRTMHKEKTVTGKNLFEQKMRRRWAEIWPIGYVPAPV